MPFFRRNREDKFMFNGDEIIHKNHPLFTCKKSPKGTYWSRLLFNRDTAVWFNERVDRISNMQVIFEHFDSVKDHYFVTKEDYTVLNTLSIDSTDPQPGKLTIRSLIDLAQFVTDIDND